VYCHHFRMRPRDLNRYACKLRLLQHGLLAEAAYLDAIGEEYEPAPGSRDVSDAPAAQDDCADGVSRAREDYVRRMLRAHTTSLGDLRRDKHEGALTARRVLIKEFMKDIVASRQCAGCNGISPTYRKDRFVKIFEKALNPKEQAKMAAGQFKIRDAMALGPKGKTTPRHEQIDEGIADVDTSSSGDESNSEEEGDGDDVTGDDGEAVEARRGKRGKDSGLNTPRQRYLSPREVLERLRLLFNHEQEILFLVYNSRPSHGKGARIAPDMFFLQTILVPPNRYRPEARTGDAQITESQQNSLYKMILGASFKLARVHRDITNAHADGSEPRHKGNLGHIASLHEAWAELQECVNSLIDRNRNPVQGQAAKRNEDGIKQKLEKKEGLFRKNMMGKRVNYAARSVISPDPNIETNEIGVPPVFARKLTYPEPVTNHNFKEMQQAVINGVDRWPGASAIENENGQIVNLRNKTPEDRMSLANQLLAPANNNFSGSRGKKVHRHLTNGDVVLMNRQPTLHKPSIMGHRVRVLPGEKTIRMHYANCNTYNADFDGDEMNMHFPQNEIARAEALQLADTDHQYVSATQGKPLRGLIQDHLSVSVALCSKDTMFDRAAYQQLVYSALRPESGHISGDRIELVRPAILKPAVRWTGKQVITTLLRNIKPPDCGDLWMSGKSQVPGDRWGPHVEEGSVEFRDGVLMTGILDKQQLGPSSGGVVHAVHEIYGPSVAGKFLSSLGRLLTKLLNMRAFTCGMDDLRLTDEGESRRRAELAAAGSIGLRVAAAYVTLGDRNPSPTDSELLARLESVMRDDTQQEGLDMLTTQSCVLLSSQVTKACLPDGLRKQFPRNHMQTMTISGAKGSIVNANLISCNLGQQVLEGRRVPLMVSGKSLPCFEAFETDVRAGGYIVSRFLTGIRPQEYYFHHMAGREGLIDTAVKTSRSGYLQRCLIKGMEGLGVAYDSSVRDSDGTLVQFLYGEDGLDVTKQKYLTDFQFLLRNFDSQVRYINFSDPATAPLFEQREAIVKLSRRLTRVAAAGRPCLDAPVNAVWDPARFAFATSEKFFSAMSEYIKKNEHRLIREKSDELEGKRVESDPIPRAVVGKKAAEKMLVAKHLRSLVESGEAVGIVAGQSVGEPSTQMTLNTFHLAGHAAKNVTQGIPRLREILMTASANISTPTMRLVLNPELSREDGEKFSKSISMLPLSHVLDTVTVRERSGKGVGHSSAKMYDIRLRFFPSAEYMSSYAAGVGDVLGAVERRLLPALRRLIDRETWQRRASKSSAAVPDVGSKAGVVEMANDTTHSDAGQMRDEDDGDDDVDGGDGDATSAKQRANRSEAVSYGPNDEEDDAIQMRMAREAASEDEAEEDEGYGGSPPPPTADADPAGDTDDRGSDGQEELSKTREARVKSNNAMVSRFRCDEEGGEWCEFTLEFSADTPKMLMLSLVQDAIRKSVIQQIEGIGSCSFDPDGEAKDLRTGLVSGTGIVHTVGANIKAMQRYSDFLDPNRILSNDIAAILDVFGVEACRNSIVRELGDVFSGHGIGVDNRHLNLIGDFMTRNGEFTPFNRMGLRGNASPFTKMSFETTLAFLKDALVDGDWDNLTTPSSRLVMGRLGRVGTGAFDVLTRAPTLHHESCMPNRTLI